MWSKAKKLFKPFIYRALNVTWNLFFHLAGGFHRRRPATVFSNGKSKVLVVAPHPDDEVIGCGGAVLRHLALGDRVRVVYVTDGSASKAMGLSPKAMAARRHGEVAEAMRRLGIAEWEWLGLPEHRWRAETLKDALVGIFARIEPTVIYAPSLVDFHPEHHRCARGLAMALAAVDTSAELRIYQIQVPLTGLLVNLAVDVTDTMEPFRGAAAAYKSQAGNMDRTVRQRGYAARYHRCGSYAEEFWSMTAEAYCLLHESGLEAPSTGAFRGIRFSPLTDPLAYWKGRKIRTAMKLNLESR